MSTASNRLFETDRPDAWWVGPLVTAAVLVVFGIYSTWVAFLGVNYQYGPYLSPFYSPFIPWKSWPFSPALLILWSPLGFRATCYYYRKAYYRAFFMDPPGCAVGEARGSGYKGETSFPFIIQNIHRYFFYTAIVVVIFLWIDVFKAFWWDGQFGMGLGTLVMLVNVCLLSSYTLGCHSLRHLIGGRIDCFSCTKFGPAQNKAWKGASFFNARHMLFAWCSLISVALTDVYIRLCSLGIIHDVRFF